jgi:integrase
MRPESNNENGEKPKSKKYPIKHKRPQGLIIERGAKQFQVWLHSHRDAQGKPVRYMKTFDTLKKADAHLAEKVAEKNGEGRVFDTTKKLRVLIEWYLDSHASKVRPQTHATVRYFLTRYAMDKIGHRRVRDLRPGDFTEFFLELKARGGVNGAPLSGGVVGKIYNSLKAVFNAAHEMGLVKANLISAPPINFGREKEILYFTPEQVQRFLETWQELDKTRSKHARGFRFGPVWHFGFETGVRPEELAGLREIDLNLHPEQFGGSNLPPMVHIRQVAVRHPMMKGWHFDKPKTPKSRRVIPISRRLADAIEEHLEHVRWYKAKERKRRWSEHGLVFPNSKGEPLYSYRLRAVFKIVVEKMGLDPTHYSPYIMRHTMATLLLQRNVNPKVVSERLGHSSISQTLDTYSHVMPSLQIDATGYIEEAIFRTKDSQPDTVLSGGSLIDVWEGSKPF